MEFLGCLVASALETLSDADLNALQASVYYLTALRFAESAVMTGAGLDPSWPATLR
jgi:hypothetical protein